MTHRDVMFDLETLGQRAGCVPRSIGAVFFAIQGGTSHEFYRNIDRASALAADLHISPETAAWWAKQAPEAQAALLVDPKPLKAVVLEFANWFKARGGERIWCQGANFDAPIWEAASAAVGQLTPWKFWNVRDTRTAYDLYRFDTKSIPRKGTYHNALDDAKHQVICLQAAVKNLGLQSVDVFA